MSREEWLKWRKEGIGSSDAAIVMGESKYGTPLKLYEDKTSDLTEEKNQNWQTAKGNEAEPKIRALVEIHFMADFAPKSISRDDHSWLRASLDGMSKDRSEVIEIKLLNKNDWDAAKNSMIVPRAYWIQMQHQLMVSGAAKNHFCAYLYQAFEADPHTLTLDNLAVVTVLPDLHFQAELFQAESDFWNHVKSRKPPVPSDRDYVPLTGLADVVKKWTDATVVLDKAQAEVDALRKVILDAAKASGHPRLHCAGLRITQSSRAGSVDYSKIPELNGVNLEKYRKAGSVVWTVAPITKGKKNG